DGSRRKRARAPGPRCTTQRVSGIGLQAAGFISVTVLGIRRRGGPTPRSAPVGAGGSKHGPGLGRRANGAAIRLGRCPLTTKIARPAVLTCCEESSLSICGSRDVCFARF